MLNEDAKIKNILGKTGSGKSILCVYEWIVPALLDGEDVWTNLWINWAGLDAERQNYHYFQSRDWETILKIRNAVIVFDEYRQSLDPRRYDDETEEQRAFFELHRHYHNDIRGNTQDVSLVAKTVGIQAHEWSQVEQLDPTWLQKIWDWFTGTEAIRIKRDYLTFQELKKMANGWELGEDVAIDAEWSTHKFTNEQLICHELDEYKQELIHRYCPKCRMRTGEQIKKEDTDKLAERIENKKGKTIKWILRKDEYCNRPNHKDIKLELKETGMFDSDYIPETITKPFFIKKFSKCGVCGMSHELK